MNQIEITCTRDQFKTIHSNVNSPCIAGYCPYSDCPITNSGSEQYCPYQWNNIKVHIVEES